MRRPRIIEICLPLLMVPALNLWAMKQPEMPDNFGTDEWAVTHWEEAVGYLKYVANKETREKLLNLPELLKFDAWENLWKESDPMPTTPANEFRDQYFARIRYANENFAEMLQPGWLTYRGEAYIRLGPPDNIEIYNMLAGYGDLEIWGYWTPYEINLVFQDHTGVGDFYLLNPSELLDHAYFR